jgi:hypothetical protein
VILLRTQSITLKGIWTGKARLIKVSDLSEESVGN